MKSILIYSPYIDAKLEYVCAFIFAECLKTEFKLTEDAEAFKEAKDYIKLAYSDEAFANCLHIPNSSYFDDFSIETDPEFDLELSIDKRRYSFDLLAAIFFNLSRVEEYRNYDKDEHGRFKSEDSILVKKSVHQYPVVDMWLHTLAQSIEDMFDVIFEGIDAYSFRSSLDIDLMYAYKNKNRKIQFLSFARDLLFMNFRRILDRFEKTDPYDRFDWLIDEHRKREIEGMVFFLCAERATYDKNLNVEHPAFKATVDKMAEYFDLGIHPSYASNYDESKLISELRCLETISEQNISASRQHYLKMKMPGTYRTLLAQGITQDHTMGYHDQIGFRAGTARDFYWFDLDGNSSTALRIFPFQAMDVSLRKYLNLAPAEALKAVKKLVDNIRKYGGRFCLLWHNSSFYETEGWKHWDALYLELLDYAKK